MVGFMKYVGMYEINEVLSCVNASCFNYFCFRRLYATQQQAYERVRWFG